MKISFYLIKNQILRNLLIITLFQYTIEKCANMKKFLCHGVDFKIIFKNRNLLKFKIFLI